MDRKERERKFLEIFVWIREVSPDHLVDGDTAVP